MYPISRIHLLIKTLNNLSQELTQAVTSGVRGGGGPGAVHPSPGPSTGEWLVRMPLRHNPTFMIFNLLNCCDF